MPSVLRFCQRRAKITIDRYKANSGSSSDLAAAFCASLKRCYFVAQISLLVEVNHTLCFNPSLQTTQATLRPTDAGITKTMLAHFYRIIDIAQIDDDRRPQKVLHFVEIETAELIPFGHENQRVSVG